jgi:cardiolipin synthase
VGGGDAGPAHGRGIGGRQITNADPETPVAAPVQTEPPASAGSPARLAVPAALSTLRLILAVLFPLMAGQWRVVVVVAAGLSDWLDGLAARHFARPTWWGALLDAVSDKAFTLTVLVVLTLEDRLAVWQALLLIARDLAVATTASIATVRGGWASIRKVRARKLGKVTTVGLFALFIVMLGWPDAEWVNLVALSAAMGLSLAAAADYLVQFNRTRPSPAA